MRAHAPSSRAIDSHGGLRSRASCVPLRPRCPDVANRFQTTTVLYRSSPLSFSIGPKRWHKIGPIPPAKTALPFPDCFHAFLFFHPRSTHHRAFSISSLLFGITLTSPSRILVSAHPLFAHLGNASLAVSPASGRDPTNGLHGRKSGQAARVLWCSRTHTRSYYSYATRSGGNLPRRSLLRSSRRTLV